MVNDTMKDTGVENHSLKFTETRTCVDQLNSLAVRINEKVSRSDIPLGPGVTKWMEILSQESQAVWLQIKNRSICESNARLEWWLRFWVTTKRELSVRRQSAKKTDNRRSFAAAGKFLSVAPQGILSRMNNWTLPSLHHAFKVPESVTQRCA